MASALIDVCAKNYVGNIYFRKSSKYQVKKG